MKARAVTLVGVFASHRWLALAALLFGTGLAATFFGRAAMVGMSGMPMPGGWTMSMLWMRLPGQSWAGAAARFMAMWAAMLPPMMLPALLPALARHRRVFAGHYGAAQLDVLTAQAAAGYFAVWLVQGGVVYALGTALAAIAMRDPVLAARAPSIAALMLIGAGVVQWSRRKAQLLGSCHTLSATGDAAWRAGARLGWHCSVCSVGLTAALLIAGIMDLRVMALVTVMISAERLTPRGVVVARVIGVALIASGCGLYVVATAF